MIMGARLPCHQALAQGLITGYGSCRGSAEQARGREGAGGEDHAPLDGLLEESHSFPFQ